MNKCEHGKQTRYCKGCGGAGICEHGKHKHFCKECGGSAFCEHNKLKRQCKECGGSGICEHGKRKSYCKECEGSAFCEHERQRSHCKECGGSGICEHGKEKRTCRECGGSAFCEHGKNKSFCKECGGSAFCEHGKQKRRCKECGGLGICQHGKEKTNCKECGGSAFCEHGRYKQSCKDCGGSGICNHGKHKRICKECGGSSICEHGKNKTRCKECGGSQLCKSSWCETRGNPKYECFCVACFVNNPENQHKPVMRNYKTKEKDVVDRIKHYFPNFTWVADKRVQDGCSLRRPDLLLDMGTHIIIVEVDENQHSDYDCSCEHKRLMQISQDVGHRPIVFIRFNPDAYTNQEGVLVKSCWKLNQLGVMKIMKTKEKEWEERIENLKTQIQYWIDNPTEKTVEIIQLFY
jgi:hypothetical protein